MIFPASTKISANATRPISAGERMRDSTIKITKLITLLALAAKLISNVLCPNRFLNTVGDHPQKRGRTKAPIRRLGSDFDKSSGLTEPGYPSQNYPADIQTDLGIGSRLVLPCLNFR